MSKSVEKCARHVSSSSSSSSSMGVQRFCSKLRHKIEDNLTTKLYKGSRHSMSLGSLSGIAESTTGKYTNKSIKTVEGNTTSGRMYGMLKHKRVANKCTQQVEIPTSIPVAETSEPCSFAGTYIDSDDEYQMPSLSWTKQSLEDEIFEELEKAAHDESKLNTVLKTFDRILTDFQQEATPAVAVVDTPKTTPNRLHSKSVLELSVPASKIPIWKALPLSKRSNSFCSEQPPVSQPITRNRAVSYMSLTRRQPLRTLKPEKSTGVTTKQLIKSKTELNVKTKTKPQSRSSTPQLRTQPATGNLKRANTNSDELLDKCLEKGQQILRKIESLGVQGGRLRAATNVAHNGIKKEQLAKKPATEKVTTVSKYLAHKGRQNSDALSDDSGHISNEADNNHALLSESASSATDSFCDYDIHNKKLTPTTTAATTTITKTTTTTTTTITTPTHNIGSTRSLKISELLQKFEAPSSCIRTTAIEAPARTICHSLKVAEVEPVHCIRTHVEIYPNYSKEVTTWFY